MLRLLRYVILMFCLSLQASAGSRGLTVPVKSDETQDAEIVAEVELYAKSYSLVIGIDEYEKWPRLSNAVKDAKLVAAALEKNGFDVTLKLNLSSREMKDAFEEFFIFKGADPQAGLFVWFAGHGDTQDGEGFLIPRDAPLPSAGAPFRFKALSLRRFGEYVRLAKSKHALSIFDSCFSGTIFETARSAPPPAITKVTTSPVRQFLSSGDAGQAVSDDGTFRRMFIEAITGQRRADANGDGYLTGSELGLFLTDSVTNYSNRRQTPRYGKLNDPDFDQGDFVFRIDTVAAARTAPAVPKVDREALFWDSIRDSKDTGDYHAYLEQYPDGSFAGLAEARIASLLKSKREHAQAISHPYDGDWNGWLRTYGGLFNSPVEAEFKATVRESRLKGTVFMYGETRTINATVSKNGQLLNGRLQGSVQSYDLKGAIQSGLGDGAWMGWKLEYKMKRSAD